MNPTQLVFEQCHINRNGELEIDSYAIVDSYVTGYRVIEATIATSFSDPDLEIHRSGKGNHVVILKPADKTFNVVLRVVDSPIITLEDVAVSLRKIEDDKKHKEPEMTITIK